eukprot:Skav235651  [mRNA]  locus=scaffold358:708543:711769:- [translate_table: standard]
MEAHQSQQARDPKWSKTILREVTPHPRPVIAVKVDARHREDKVSKKQHSEGKVRILVLVDHRKKGGQRHKCPAT